MWLIAIPVALILTFAIAYAYWRFALRAYVPRPIRCFLVHEVLPHASYSSASEISLEVFRTFIDEVYSAGLQFVTPEVFFESKSPDDILLTFDDGFESVYEHVFPILKEKNIHALVFRVGNHEGRTSDWDYRSSNRKHLSKMEIEEMIASGLVSFGAHTQTHPDLTRITDERLEAELASGSLDLFRCFSFPFGRINRRVKDAVKEAGYYRAFCSLNGDPKLWDKKFAIPRFPLNRFDNRLTLRAKIRGNGLFWLEVVKSRVIGMFSQFTHDWKGR
jgi:peptidoglycan/xylan/chitin deacetylase (PgdA/CDA1 family)